MRPFFGHLRCLPAFFFALALCIGDLHADDGLTVPSTWTQWRGPNRDGHVAANSDWPNSLSEGHLSKQWRVPMGPSYSGPIVSATQVFTTETRNAKDEVVRALDRTSGKVLWEAGWPGALSVPFFAKANGDWIRATPAYDGEKLYVAGIRDLLVCLDANTGKEIWKVDFVKRYGTAVPSFGFVCSPLVTADAIYVQAGASLVKLNKETGESIWRSLVDEGGMNGSAFSSPTIATLNGVEQLLVQTRTKLAGVDLKSGKVQWEQDVPAFRGMNILTPLAWNDSVFTSSYGGKSFLYSPNPSSKTVALTWTNKVEGYMSTPVMIKDHLYLHLRNQRLTCIRMNDGKTSWTTTPFGKYMSLVTNGDKILALDERGVLVLFAANSEKFEQLDSRQISEDDTWAHLAVCGDEIFVRERNAMTVFRWK